MNTTLSLLGPIIAEAAIPPAALNFIRNVINNVLNPFIAIMFVVATAYFFYGVARYIWQPDDEEAREKGRKSMLWGVIGMFIMIAVFGIMRFIISTIGADPNLMNYV